MRAVRAAFRAHRGAVVAFAAAVLVGGLARALTVRWGSPFLFHPDERGFVMWEAAAIEWRGLLRGDFRPRTTTYGPLVYETALALKWIFLGGIAEARREAAAARDEWAYVQAALSAEPDGKPFSFLAWTHLCRGFGALASAIAIALLGCAAWRLAGPRAGVVTAWLAALCAGLIQASHFWTTDSLLLVEIAMLLDACSQMARPRVVFRGGRIRERGAAAALYAGVALGLMAATKVTGLLLLAAVSIAIAHSTGSGGALRSDRALAGHWLGRSIAALATRRFAIVVATMIATYFVLCPWAFLEPEAYYDVPPNRSGRDVFLSQYTDRDYGFYDWRFTYNGTLPYVYLLTNVLPYAVGGPVLAAAAVEMGRALRKDAAAARIAASAAIPTFLLVGSWGVKTIRYAIPSVPGILLAAGIVIARALERGSPAARVLAGLAFALGLARGVAFTGMFLENDPRVLAARWLRERLRPGDVVVVEPEASYTAPLGPGDDGIGASAPPPFGVHIRRLWQDAPSDVDGHLAAVLQGARYLVVGEFYLRRGLHPEAPMRAPRHAEFYRRLVRGLPVGPELEFVRVATFARAPCLGPLCWDESEAEILAVSFDHMPVYIFERVLRNEPLVPTPAPERPADAPAPEPPVPTPAPERPADAPAPP
jgi:hypothetical protein